MGKVIYLALLCRDVVECQWGKGFSRTLQGCSSVVLVDCWTHNQEVTDYTNGESGLALLQECSSVVECWTHDQKVTG